jgi:hypothetical protein
MNNYIYLVTFKNDEKLLSSNIINLHKNLTQEQLENISSKVCLGTKSMDVALKIANLKETKDVALKIANLKENKENKEIKENKVIKDKK